MTKKKHNVQSSLDETADLAAIIKADECINTSMLGGASNKPSDDVTLTCVEFDTLKAKAEPFDMMAQALTDAGFETSTMTYNDQAHMLITMALEGVDAEMVVRLKNIDTYLRLASTQIETKIEQLDSIIEEITARADIVRKVSKIAMDVDGRLEDIALTAANMTLDYHEQAYHGKRVKPEFDAVTSSGTHEWTANYDVTDYEAEVSSIYDAKTHAFYIERKMKHVS